MRRYCREMDAPTTIADRVETPRERGAGIASLRATSARRRCRRNLREINDRRSAALLARLAGLRDGVLAVGQCGVVGRQRRGLHGARTPWLRVPDDGPA